MPNEMRDRLVELMVEADAYDGYECKLCTDDHSCFRCYFTKLADHLIENGVIVPPIKLGSRQKVYIPVKYTTVIYDTKVYGIGVDEEGDFVINPKEYPEDVICINGYNIGKTVFLTKAEAEQKLKEMRGE